MNRSSRNMTIPSGQLQSDRLPPPFVSGIESLERSDGWFQCGRLTVESAANSDCSPSRWPCAGLLPGIGSSSCKRILFEPKTSNDSRREVLG
jgi:hypothetical protein